MVFDSWFCHVYFINVIFSFGFALLKDWLFQSEPYEPMAAVHVAVYNLQSENRFVRYSWYLLRCSATGQVDWYICCQWGWWVIYCSLRLISFQQGPGMVTTWINPIDMKRPKCTNMRKRCATFIITQSQLPEKSISTRIDESLICQYHAMIPSCCYLLYSLSH